MIKGIMGRQINDNNWGAFGHASHAVSCKYYVRVHTCLLICEHTLLQ